jgi:hypothetical protein
VGEETLLRKIYKISVGGCGKIFFWGLNLNFREILVKINITASKMGSLWLTIISQIFGYGQMSLWLTGMSLC